MEKSLHKGISGAGLKWIAIITMLIDHIGAVVLMPLISMSMMRSGNSSLELMSVYTILRTIGRISFPIFCFLIVEGFFHTKDVKKYGLRLALFALISEAPFDLALFGKPFETSHQNIFFTLTIGLFTIFLFSKMREKSTALAFVIPILGAALAEVINTDYGAYGVLLIFIFYLFREKSGPRLIAFVILAIINLFFSYFMANIPITPQIIPAILPSLIPVLALIPIEVYNGERGKQPKYFFYLFYPVHLLLLYFIRMAVIKM